MAHRHVTVMKKPITDIINKHCNALFFRSANGGGGCGDGSVDKASIRSRVQIVGIRVKSRQL